MSKGKTTNLATKNPSVAGKSTSSSTMMDSDSDEPNETTDDDDDDLTEGSEAKNPEEKHEYISFDTLLPPLFIPPPPSTKDLHLYKRAATLSK